MELQVNSITHQISLAAELSIKEMQVWLIGTTGRNSPSTSGKEKNVSVLCEAFIDAYHRYSYSLENIMPILIIGYQVKLNSELVFHDNDFQWRFWTFSSSLKISNHKSFAHWWNWFKSKMQNLVSCAPSSSSFFLRKYLMYDILGQF